MAEMNQTIRDALQAHYAEFSARVQESINDGPNADRKRRREHIKKLEDLEDALQSLNSAGNGPLHVPVSSATVSRLPSMARPGRTSRGGSGHDEANTSAQNRQAGHLGDGFNAKSQLDGASQHPHATVQPSHISRAHAEASVYDQATPRHVPTEMSPATHTTTRVSSGPTATPAQPHRHANNQQPSLYDQLDPERYPTVIWLDGAWVEVRCPKCHANFGERSNRTFNGMQALSAHVQSCDPSKPTGFSHIAKICHKRKLSEEDVDRIKRGEQPKHEITLTVSNGRTVDRKTSPRRDDTAADSITEGASEIRKDNASSSASNLDPPRIFNRFAGPTHRATPRSPQRAQSISLGQPEGSFTASLTVRQSPNPDSLHIPADSDRAGRKNTALPVGSGGINVEGDGDGSRERQPRRCKGRPSYLNLFPNIDANPEDDLTVPNKVTVYEQLDEEFPTIVKLNGVWYEIWCKFCGTNTKLQDGKYLDGLPGLLAHVTQCQKAKQQAGAKKNYKQKDWVEFCGLRTLSEEDVNLMRDKKEPHVRIERFTGFKTKAPPRPTQTTDPRRSNKTPQQPNSEKAKAAATLDLNSNRASPDLETLPTGSGVPRPSASGLPSAFGNLPPPLGTTPNRNAYTSTSTTAGPTYLSSGFIPIPPYSGPTGTKRKGAFNVDGTNSSNMRPYPKRVHYENDEDDAENMVPRSAGTPPGDE